MSTANTIAQIESVAAVVQVLIPATNEVVTLAETTIGGVKAILSVLPHASPLSEADLMAKGSAALASAQQIEDEAARDRM